ncbi:MerR family transcriptional regulator [Mangrovibacterium diazotrophicum]|uniref:DNA-binding transcriptional MerR regulator n=1 Tax=Mangrovibacterium diazotrophicum TaxID=1261403 RepID=A0A419W353_9BACT|nr:MerR family transcriptional regulator [Mangrovibacterium diazotrophicum]RKD89730.1 DNA-binding transcriptional MerR regulator [Mangrovibacterium diazotrophicum]
MNYYTIKDLESLSGIKAHTIRIWEKRYGLLVPDRTSTNIRFYTDDELKHLLNVAALVKRGHKISKVSVYTAQRIREEVLKLNREASSMDDFIDQLVIHILNFDTEKLEDLLDTLQSRFGFEKMITDVIFPLFQKVGVYWQIGSMFPAQEHMVSNLVRQRIIVESSKMNHARNGKTVLLFLPENEQHELGLLFSRYLAQKDTFDTIYLGQNVPFADIHALAGTKAVDLIVTVFVNAMEKEDIEKYLRDLRSLFGNVPVSVSGLQVKAKEPALPANVYFINNIEAYRDLLAKVNRG